MNRSDWLKKKRHSSEERYDRLWSPIYDKNWAEIDPVHRRFVTQLVNACPENASILDAACGTGKYWPILLASGRRFTGIDQSQAMLKRATNKYPQVRVKKFGLQEINFQEAFDLILCIDAMEMISPEDWSMVLANFHQALKPHGQLYFTVEIADPSVIEHDFQAALDQGLPVIFGESVAPTGPGDDQGGYHYYPSMDQVRQWLTQAGFMIKEEDESADYHHFWVEKT
jgi:2-polyprenyl-3-methyl-5-hydroxy-6-metoxy-1,4-benzoquinol methylase